MAEGRHRHGDGITLVHAGFNMNGFLAGDIDAAQAMTYNEYAQVLETVNPDTGELYQPDDFNVINWNDEGTAMLPGRDLGRRRRASPTTRTTPTPR